MKQDMCGAVRHGEDGVFGKDNGVGFGNTSELLRVPVVGKITSGFCKLGVGFVKELFEKVEGDLLRPAFAGILSAEKIYDGGGAGVESSQDESSGSTGLVMETGSRPVKTL